MLTSAVHICNYTPVRFCTGRQSPCCPTALDSMLPVTFSIVFPGQGSQRNGMGADFFEVFAAARAVYQEASEAVGLDIFALCTGDDDRLRLTEYAQPAILATEIAMLESMRAEFGLEAQYYGGHSLGEYTALVAAGVVSLADATRTVGERGHLMQKAVPAGQGRMVAVLGQLPDSSEVKTALQGLTVAIANDNSTQQFVISGLAEDTRMAELRISELAGASAIRFVELDVSAPFHSPLMGAIEEPFEAVLEDIAPAFCMDTAPSVVSNYTGNFHSADRSQLVTALVRQVISTVRWQDNMRHLNMRGSRILEIGPGRPLRGFFKTLDVAIESITSVRSAEKCLRRDEPV